MKKTKLTETEKFAIAGMLAENYSTEDIAKQLNRSVAMIDKYIETTNPKPTTMFINKTATGREGISIMTEAASQKGDSVAASPSKPSTAIHKIYNG